jgi:hypothetical protein
VFFSETLISTFLQIANHFSKQVYYQICSLNNEVKSFKPLIYRITEFKLRGGMVVVVVVVLVVVVVVVVAAVVIVKSNETCPATP